jgi:hypothetical protein
MSYADAQTAGYINDNNTIYFYPSPGNPITPLSCTTGTLTPSSPRYALIEDDFGTGIFPTTLETNLRERLCEYINDGSTWYSMLSIANQGDNSIGSLTEDQVWDAFVGLYISTRNQLIED